MKCEMQNLIYKDKDSNINVMSFIFINVFHVWQINSGMCMFDRGE